MFPLLRLLSRRLVRPHRCIGTLVGMVSILAASMPVHAALDADQSSIERDRVQLKAAATVHRSLAGFAVHSYTLPGGTEVREYAASGKVFAVSWHGPHIPNLHQLLGVHHATFLASPYRQRGGLTHLVVQDSATSPNLVVESHGRQGGFHGRAYLIKAFPAGITPADIS